VIKRELSVYPLNSADAITIPNDPANWFDNEPPNSNAYDGLKTVLEDYLQNGGTLPPTIPLKNKIIYTSGTTVKIENIRQNRLTLNRGRKGLRRTSHGIEDGLGTTRT
jgi:hypothetical protein